MKKTSKALLLGLCALLLVGASVLGTMAYLTSTTEQVVNTFTVGKVAITLDEAKVDENGTEVAGAARVQDNTYKLMPGHEYKKDPTVHVTAGSENCYLFVKVDNGISGIETTTANKKIASQMTANKWLPVDAEKYPNVYVLTDGTDPKAVAAESNHEVFGNFTIDGDVKEFSKPNEDGKLTEKITVIAYAIQADGFAGKTASEIWEAGFVTK